MKKLEIKGHQDFLGVNIPIIEGGFGENNRSVLAKTISEIHKSKIKKVNQAINRLIEKQRLIKDVDYIDLKSLVASGDQYTLTWFYDNLGISQQAYYRSEHIYLLSERGYIKFVKYIEDDTSWDIMDKFVNEYFSMREQLKINERTLLLSNIINSQDVEQALAIQKFEQYVKKPLLETIDNQEKIIATQKPKVEYCDNVLKCDRLLSTTVIAKDLGISARKLNQILTSYKVIYKRNGTYVPYSNYQWLITKGYADYFIYEDKNVPQQLKWTEKGRKWIIDSINKFKNNRLERNFISE